VASAARDFAIPAGFIALGEVGLAGEVRRISGLKRRLSEAARLGVTHAIVPTDAGPHPAGMTVYEVGTLREALAVIGKFA
jgi:DNA repair protein RadA/Sms